MSEYKKNHSNRRPFSKGNERSFGPKSHGPRELFEAECNNCHRRCEVPFRPNGRKPVYCPDCFTQNDDRGARPQFQKRSFSDDRRPAPVAQPDPRIDALVRKVESLQASVDKLLSIVESSTRAAALTKEVRKHVPAAKPANPPKKAAAKKVVKKAAKKAAPRKKG